MTLTVFMDFCVDTGLTLFAVAIAVGFFRLWYGPSLGDRVVALDMMTAAVIGFCGLFAVRARSEGYLDIAVALALVSFVTVVALARYAERLARRDGHDD